MIDLTAALVADALDALGVVVCPAACANEVRAAVRRKLDGESGARADLEQGVPVRVVWERWGVL